MLGVRVAQINPCNRYCAHRLLLPSPACGRDRLGSATESAAVTSRGRRTSPRASNMSVQEYIDKHELTKRVEDAINATVKAKPDEPLSFLVRVWSASQL